MNIFNNLPIDQSQEEITTLLSSGTLRIERIVSNGQCSPPDFWYDQEEHEWVLVLSGQGDIEYPDKKRITLSPGDHLHIPPRVRHRVCQTSQEVPTIWLAVFWPDQIEAD